MSCEFWDPPIENRFLCPGHKVVPRAHCAPHFARERTRESFFFYAQLNFIDVDAYRPPTVHQPAGPPTPTLPQL